MSLLCIAISQRCARDFSARAELASQGIDPKSERSCQAKLRRPTETQYSRSQARQTSLLWSSSCVIRQRCSVSPTTNNGVHFLQR